MTLSNGSTHLVAFGSAQDPVLDLLVRVWGPWRERVGMPDCGADPPTLVGWANGLTVLFEDGAMAGWSAGAPFTEVESPHLQPVTTMSGTGVGSMRVEVEAATVLHLRESTLGTEFEAAGISGVLENGSPTATVVALWAGRACLFR